jgi:hypothetical protein
MNHLKEKKMKPFSRILVFVLAASLIASCGTASDPTPTQVFQGENPYAPQASDSDLMSGDITIDSSSVNLAKSQPPQVMVSFAYFQPTPCYQLRVEVSGPDEQNKITLKAYAVAEKDKPCTLMALSTPLQASLNLGSYPKGHYTVWLNENQIGEFDS